MGGSLLAHPHSHLPHLLCPLSLSSRPGREVGHTSSLETLPVEASGAWGWLALSITEAEGMEVR